MKAAEFHNPTVRLNPIRASLHRDSLCRYRGEPLGNTCDLKDPAVRNYRAPVIHPAHLDEARKAWAEGNVGRFLWLADGPDRVTLFMYNVGPFKRRGLLEEALAFAYSTPSRGMALGLSDFKAVVDMCDRDRLRAQGDPMPDGDDPVTLYRGVSRWSGRRRGFSWTGTLPIAVWFACRATEANENPLVLTFQAKRTDFLLYNALEDEYVTIPPPGRRLVEVPITAAMIAGRYNHNPALPAEQELVPSKHEMAS